MIGQMAIVIALLGFNDLGRSVIPTILFRVRFIYDYDYHCPKIKSQFGEFKKF